MKNLMQSVKENLSFVAVCLLIFAALVLVAWLFERFVIKERRKLGGARYVATMGMCAALGAVLMVLEIPVFFAPPFYKLDFSEIPMLFCSFYLGPVAGVLAELLKNLIKLLLKGTSTAFVGEFANFAVSCALVPAGVDPVSYPQDKKERPGRPCHRDGHDDGLWQRVQRDLPAAEVRSPLWDAARCHCRYGQRDQRGNPQRFDTGAVRRRAAEPFEGRRRLGHDVLAV